LPPGAEVRTFTVVFNNVPYDAALMTAWGFGCLVETEVGTVLFDTGGDGGRLLRNMERLGLDPLSIDAVVLSHIHGDHTGGLSRLLDTGVQPTVYVLASFPAAFKDTLRARTEVVEVTRALEILPGIHTTGELGTSIKEQALVVETAQGTVVLTGCSHPGVVEMVRGAQAVVAGEILLVTGGFHLVEASRAQITRIISELRDLSVRQALPSHCSGDLAMEMFAQAFETDFVAGLGWILTLDAPQEID
jgi:7,8-dihydropterin-6-yl-methyl-4-(beta-D-ribofuranosyl)aminobenzene 5'-phosphate synthase